MNAKKSRTLIKTYGMTALENLRNDLISKLLVVHDEELLKAISTLISLNESSQVQLTESQKQLLQMSENDIAYGRTSSQDELFDRERKWLNEK